MGYNMTTQIVKIGNSRGVRIPKSFIDESGLKSEVELEVTDGKIIIKPISKPRELWDSVFRNMSRNNDDILLDSQEISSQSSWDNDEWEW